MSAKPFLLLGTTCLALVLSAAQALADSSNGKSNQAKGQNGKDASSQHQSSQPAKGKKTTHSTGQRPSSGSPGAPPSISPGVCLCSVMVSQ